jgi:hypothetical protein
MRLPTLREVQTQLQILEYLASTREGLTPADRLKLAQLEALQRVLKQQGAT